VLLYIEHTAIRKPVVLWDLPLLHVHQDLRQYGTSVVASGARTVWNTCDDASREHCTAWSCASMEHLCCYRILFQYGTPSV
jgi:hypothetical protein